MIFGLHISISTQNWVGFACLREKADKDGQNSRPLRRALSLFISFPLPPRRRHKPKPAPLSTRASLLKPHGMSNRSKPSLARAGHHETSSLPAARAEVSSSRVPPPLLPCGACRLMTVEEAHEHIRNNWLLPTDFHLPDNWASGTATHRAGVPRLNQKDVGCHEFGESA